MRMVINFRKKCYKFYYSWFEISIWILKYSNINVDPSK